MTLRMDCHHQQALAMFEVFVAEDKGIVAIKRYYIFGVSEVPAVE